MKYLDEQIVEQITGTIAGTSTGMYEYRVLRKNDSDNSYTTIFIGSMFHQYGTAFRVDITDIVRNDSWIPDESVLYSSTDVAAQTIKLVNTYKVDFIIGGTSYRTDGVQVAKVYRYPHTLNYMTDNVFFDYTTSDSVSYPLQGRYSLGDMGYYHLLPRYPYISTDNYKLILVSENGLNLGGSYLNISGKIIGEKEVLYTPPATLTTLSLSNLYSGSTYHVFSGALLAGYQGQTSNYSITLPSDKKAVINARDAHTDELYVKLVRMDSNHDIVEEYTPEWIIVNQAADVQITFNSNFFDANDNSRLVLLLSPRHDTVITNADEVDRIAYKFNISSESYNSLLNKTAVCTIQFRGNPLLMEWTLNKFDLSIPMTSDKTLVEVGGDYVAEIDYDCNSRYYLQWQDRMGGFQSQPFNEHYTYSENVERETITDYRGVKRISGVNITPKFKINTDWIKEDLYPYYESIFTSPVLFLYDTHEDKRYSVLVTDSEYTEKTYDNQKKLFNLSLNLELNQQQNIIY